MLVHLDVGLSHKLLTASARAYLADEPSMDWATLARSAAVSASPDAINRALSRLANEGLIDGLYTPAGWYRVRPSARGLSRAGNAARRSVAGTTTPAPDTDQPASGDRLGERLSARWVQLQAELRIVRTTSVTGWQRSSSAVSPRLAALRTTMANTWRMFTSFP